VLFHQRRQNLVFLLQLGFQKDDALFAGFDLFLGSGWRSKGRRSIV
jgi:hypothetical protein